MTNRDLNTVSELDKRSSSGGNFTTPKLKSAVLSSAGLRLTHVGRSDIKKYSLGFPKKSPSLPNFHEKTNSDTDLAGRSLSRALGESGFVHNSHRETSNEFSNEYSNDSDVDQVLDQKIVSSTSTNSNLNSSRTSQLFIPKTHRRTATNGGVSLNEDDANLSVIDMYGDEVESKLSKIQHSMDHEDEEEDEDEESQDEEEEEIHPPNETPLPNNVTNDTLVSNFRDENLDTEEKLREQKLKAARRQSTHHYDRYGFKKQSNYVSESEYDHWWNGYSQYCIRRKHKWKLLLEKSGLPIDNDSPVRFPSKSEKLKRYVRKGIPAEWRGNAWWYFARGQDKLNKNKDVYDKLLAKMDQLMKTDKKKIQDLDIIERDLHRTFPDNLHFQHDTFKGQEPPLILSLRRVLVAFSLYNPKIGYCQSMNFLAGMLLLFLDEERAFWMLVIITSRYLPGVHNVNLEGVNIDQAVLMLCIKEYLPEIWPFINPESRSSNKTSNSLGVRNTGIPGIKNEFLYKLPPITLCTASWFMGCFVGVMPVETTLRIWDCLFYEESHFLFKTSLAIFKLCENELIKIRSHGSSLLPNYMNNNQKYMSQDESDMEIFQIIQMFPKSLIDPNDLFDKVILKKRVSFNRLDQEEVDRCRKYVSSQRQKYKKFYESGRAPDEPIDEHDEESKIKATRIASDAINEALSSEIYGFKKGLTGVHWNNSIKEKVRQMRKKMDKED
ncbi:GTPase-activating protein GYP3 [Nakaseomyces bracarensis]|uniref:GTPase-activating protein GYP3 n=1 Tax=Nakaseomyces bracarensis TaxID=273131 RepID=A0ABR4NX52_9SACH